MSYVGKITTEEISNALVASTLYGTCDTAADVAAKVVQCPEFDRLMTGVTIHIKFTNRNTASNPTLNINGLGAKNIFRISSPITGQDNTKSWHNGSVVSFTYDGNQWIMNDYTEASDGKVMHSPYTGDYDYRILLGGDDDLLDYGGVGKSQYATFNPSKKAFTVGGDIIAGGSLTLGNNGDILLSSGDTWDGTNTSLKAALNNVFVLKKSITVEAGAVRFIPFSYQEIMDIGINPSEIYKYALLSCEQSIGDTAEVYTSGLIKDSEGYTLPHYTISGGIIDDVLFISVYNPSRSEQTVWGRLVFMKIEN